MMHESVLAAYGRVIHVLDLMAIGVWGHDHAPVFGSGHLVRGCARRRLRWRCWSRASARPQRHRHSDAEMTRPAGRSSASLATGGDIKAAGASVTISGDAATSRPPAPASTVNATSAGDVSIAGRRVTFSGSVGGDLKRRGRRRRCRRQCRRGNVDIAGAVAAVDATAGGDSASAAPASRSARYQ